MYEIGSLDMSIYKCITEDYTTDKIVISEKQLLHIKERHPEAYKDTISYIKEILVNPDYIIKDKRPQTNSLQT